MRIPQMSLSNEPCPDNIFIDYGNGGTEYSANDIHDYAKELAYFFKNTLLIFTMTNNIFTISYIIINYFL